VARRATPRAGTPAVVALVRAGVAHAVHECAVDLGAGYGAAAAASLGVDPSRVFKTLVAAVDGRPHVAIVPVPAQLGLKALAAAVGGKRAEMAQPALAERLTGYVVGGISPLGQRTRLPTVVDASALDGEVVYVSAGRRGLEVSLAPAELVRLTGATVAAIAVPRGALP
jgi:Cys-tRNA(Pro)/Cys-tRNA(Cys) deacylase